MMEDKYRSKKSPSLGYLLIACSVFINLLAIGVQIIEKGTFSNLNLLVIIFLTPIIALFLWFWLATYYFIKDEILVARSGPLKWRIPIKEITLIRLNQKTIGGTWKITMSRNCMEIKYKKYGAIFISPKNEEDFLNKLF